MQGRLTRMNSHCHPARPQIPSICSSMPQTGPPQRHKAQRGLSNGGLQRGIRPGRFGNSGMARDALLREGHIWLLPEICTADPGYPSHSFQATGIAGHPAVLG
jgi:hypothetical protein